MKIIRIECHVSEIEPAIDEGLYQACYNIMLKNAHKGNSWLDDKWIDAIAFLNKKLQEEFEEYQAIQYNHHVEIGKKMYELCDIINISSMLYRRYREMI